MRLLPGVPAHVDHQHVLGLEGLLLPGALVPPAHKLLLLPVDVVVVDVLERDNMEAQCHSEEQTATVFTPFFDMEIIFSQGSIVYSQSNPQPIIPIRELNNQNMITKYG